MIDFEKLTPKDVIDAYAAAGLWPVFKDFGDGVVKACALTAIVASKRDEIDYEAYLNATEYSVDEVAEFLGMDCEVVLDFILGFDGYPDGFTNRDIFEKGKAIAEAVEKEFIVF